MELKGKYCEEEIPEGRLISLKNELREVTMSLCQTNNSIRHKLNTLCYYDNGNFIGDESKEPQTILDEIQFILIELCNLDKNLAHNYNHLNSIV